MDPQLTELFRQLEQTSQENGDAPRLAREAGHFLNLLVKAMRASNLLQVGLEDGYTTLWLAEAMVITGGMVTGVEENVVIHDAARDVLERSPDTARIHLVQGDLSEVLPVLEGPFDFVLINDDGHALQYLRMLIEQINSGALICCNKAMSRAGALADYLAYVHDSPGLESILVPIGEGLELTYKVP